MAYVDYTEAAYDDLRETVSRTDLIAALMHVACTELRATPRFGDPDEGAGRAGLLWRRGITREQRRRLDAQPRETPGPHPWDFLMIYRQLAPGHLRVLRVVRTVDLVGTVPPARGAGGWP